MIRYLQRLKHKKGFTLVEMVAVMAIITFLSAMLIPQLTQFMTLAHVTNVNATAANIRKVVQGFMLDMQIQGKGLRRTGTASNGKPITITSQIIWSVNNYNWMVKTECKPCQQSGSNWVVSNIPGMDAKHTAYMDPDNWYSDNFLNVTDTITENNENHLLALSVRVRNAVSDLKTGFIMGFFKAGLCSGIVYIPDWNHFWPNASSYNRAASNIPGCTSGMTAQLRPLLIRSKNSDGGRKTSEDPGYRLREMSPWHGVWPRDVDDRMWYRSTPGVDAESRLYVGTSPVITLSKGRRKYNYDWNVVTGITTDGQIRAADYEQLQ